MTIVAEIIEEAFRESGLINELQSATPAQTKQAFSRLQTLITSVYGFEVGDALSDWPVGVHTVDSIDWTAEQWQYPRDNARLIAGLDTSSTVYLPSSPDDGARVGIIDPLGKLTVGPITLDGNGRTIEGVSTFLAGTAGLKKTWMYRADTGNWTSIDPLELISEFPFPPEFDTYFITILAMRINPTYGKTIDAQTKTALDRARGFLRARYTQHDFVPVEIALTRPSQMTADRIQYLYTLYNTDEAFKKGWPF